jgi:metallophosphoesterase (TIGR00282 family)
VARDRARLLLVGDIVGPSGTRALFLHLARLRAEHRADLVVVNVENAAAGYGLTPAIADELVGMGVNVMTSGNHIWQQREIWPRLEEDDRLLRPANYPEGPPGRGATVVETAAGAVGVLNLEGRVGMANLRCPFRVGEAEIAKLRKKTKVIVVDFHAESLEEKEAFALRFDGQVSAVVGTHTHVQTADERILPGGTAFMSDLGMTGPPESAIGMQMDTSIERALSQMPLKLTVDEGPAAVRGAAITVDVATGQAVGIERIDEAPTL